jgi:hypothetical protein
MLPVMLAAGNLVTQQIKDIAVFKSPEEQLSLEASHHDWPSLPVGLLKPTSGKDREQGPLYPYDRLDWFYSILTYRTVEEGEEAAD